MSSFAGCQFVLQLTGRAPIPKSYVSAIQRLPLIVEAVPEQQVLCPLLRVLPAAAMNRCSGYTLLDANEQPPLTFSSIRTTSAQEVDKPRL